MAHWLGTLTAALLLAAGAVSCLGTPAKVAPRVELRFTIDEGGTVRNDGAPVKESEIRKLMAGVSDPPGTTFRITAEVKTPFKFIHALTELGEEYGFPFPAVHLRPGAGGS